MNDIEIVPPIRTTDGWSAWTEEEVDTIKHLPPDIMYAPGVVYPDHLLMTKVIGRRIYLWVTDPDGRDHRIGQVKSITRTDIMPEGPETIYTVNQRKPIGYELSWET